MVALQNGNFYISKLKIIHSTDSTVFEYILSIIFLQLILSNSSSIISFTDSAVIDKEIMFVKTSAVSFLLKISSKCCLFVSKINAYILFVSLPDILSQTVVSYR